MERRPNILLDKSEAFSIRVSRMYHYLATEKKEFIFSRQVLRSGTSIGANLAEGKNAQSTSDYLSKHNIALKEADETAYWLKILHESGFLSDDEFNSIFADCEELVKMLVSSVKTLKHKLGRT